MKYILNIGSRTVHSSESRDGRCKLNLLQEENRKEFDSLEEAMQALPQGKKPTKICSFCRVKGLIGT